MNVTFLTQLAASLTGFLLLAVSYFGWGWLCRRILGTAVSPGQGGFSTIWLGWAVSIFLLQVLNLFVPVNGVSSAPILLFGCLAAVLSIMTEHLRGGGLSVPALYWVGLAIAVVWIADLSMRVPMDYNSGLYHFNSIRWLNEYPIVLGLGNLHGRLAFNQTFFVYVAYLNLFPWFNQGHVIANAFLLCMLFGECFLYFSRLISRKYQHAARLAVTLTASLFLPVIIYLTFSSSLSSPSTDIASTILQLVIFLYFIGAIYEKDNSTLHTSQASLVLILSATAITLKLSNAFFVAATCAILFLLIKLNPLDHSNPGILHRIVKLFLLPGLILAVWSFRGLLLSGCLAYPFKFGCFQLPWSMSAGSINSDAQWIFSYARNPSEMPDQVLHSLDWLSPWFHTVVWNDKLLLLYPLLIFVLTLGVVLLIRKKKNLLWEVDRAWYLVPLPALIGMIAWFLLAPDPRFANALFWILPVAAILPVLLALDASGKLRPIVLTSVFLVANAHLFLIFFQNPHMFGNFSFQGYQALPVVSLVEQKTNSGLTVLTPVKGDQCWDSALPCTPYFNVRLSFTDRPIFPEFYLQKGNKKTK